MGLNDKQCDEIPENIIGIKRTDSIKELSQIYSAADVFVNLTYCDTYPTVNLEALSCGTPVVTYRTGGSLECINQDNGFVVDAGDVDAVVEKINFYYEHPIRIDGSLLSENREFCDKTNSLKQYFNQYVNAPTVGGGYFELKEKYGLQGKFLILAVAAFWVGRKGLPDLIKLWELICKGDLSDRYRMVIVGLDNNQISSLPNRIVGISRTNGIDKLREIYSLADILVNPTKQDNYPTVNLESIACGTPVITYKTGGSVESAEFFGIVCEHNIPEALFEAILRGQRLKQGMNINESISDQTMIQKYTKLMID